MCFKKMPAQPDPRTKQVNLRIETEHEALLRETVDLIRRGGPSFRAALSKMIEDHVSARYMTVSELDDRFVAIELRLASLEAERARRKGDSPA